jgi:hypothetical protein
VEGEKQLKPAELERVKQKLDLFDFLTPTECQDLILTVAQLQGRLRDLIDLTMTLKQRLPKDRRPSAEEERILGACSRLCDEGEDVFLEPDASFTVILQR